MKIAKILEIEQNNHENIILFNEGLFWRAYERSAFRFTKHIKQYQITKKTIKNVKSDVVHCGFPKTVLPEILNLIKNNKIKKEDKQIVIFGFEKSKEDFEKWKNNIAIKIKNKEAENIISVKTKTENNIINQIKSFQLMAKSPIECQQFLIKLQNQINGTTL